MTRARSVGDGAIERGESRMQAVELSRDGVDHLQHRLDRWVIPPAMEVPVLVF